MARKAFSTLIMLAAAALPAPRAKADIASAAYYSVPYLYFEEGGQAYRARCPQGTQFYDRDTCNVEVLHARGDLLLALYREKLGDDLDKDEKTLTQVWTQIQAIKDRLFLLLNQEPAGTPQVTKAQLDAAEQRLLDARAGMQELKDQVARIQIALAESPHDADLLAQLEVTRGSLATRQKAESLLLGSLNTLRLTYAQERGSSSAQDYADLVTLWHSRSEALTYAKAQVDEQIGDIELGEQLITRLFDHTFAWPMESDPRQAVYRFESTFPTAETESRSLHFRAQDRFRVHFDLTDPRVVEDIVCRSSTQDVASPGVAYVFELMDGNQIESRAEVDWASASNGLRVTDFGDSHWSYDLLSAGGFVGRSRRGTWDISYHYLGTASGPAPDPFEPLNCALIFAR